MTIDRLLLCLKRGPQTAADIAERLNTRSADVASDLARLRRKGLVERSFTSEAKGRGGVAIYRLSAQ